MPVWIGFCRKVLWGVVVSALLFFIPDPCQAAYQMEKYDVTVAAGETIAGPFLAAGKEILINGEVKGDLYAIGTNVVVNGVIDGDLLVAGATLKVNGTVNGDVRSLSGTADINGRVGGNVSFVGRQLLLTPKGSIQQSLLLLVMRGEVNGSVQEKVCGWGSDIKLGGRIGRGVTLYNAEHLAIEERADINGPVRYSSVSSAGVSPKAFIAGNVHWERKEAGGGSAFMTLLWFFAGVLVWYTLNIIFPGFWDNLISPALKKPIAAFLWGAAVFLITPVLALMLLFTLVGIPMALIVSGFYVITLYMGKIVAGQTIGTLITEHFGRQKGFKPLTSFLMGYAVVILLGTLPYLDSFTGILSVCWAMGVICRAVVFKRRQILTEIL